MSLSKFKKIFKESCSISKAVLGCADLTLS